VPEVSGPVGGDEGSVVKVTDAFAAARGLLEGAESEAERIVTEATRRARTREQEAELLVAKARRVLEVAEDKAAAIVAVARSRADAFVTAQVRDAADQVLERAPAGGAGAPEPRRAQGARSGADAGSGPNSLDRILAAAIASAVDQALDPDGVFKE
jgi:hypothetical protein